MGTTKVCLGVPLRIHCRTGELILGRTVDVSESGIPAIIPLDMLLGQAVELDFLLDGETDRSSSHGQKYVRFSQRLRVRSGVQGAQDHRPAVARRSPLDSHQ